MDERRPPESPAPERPVHPGPQAPAYGGPVPPGGWDRPAAASRATPPDYGGRLASWGARLAAQVLDLAILLAAVLAGAGITYLTVRSSVALGVAVGVLAGLAAVTFFFLYGSLLMARKGARNGQTLGKQVLGIRVIRTDGESIDVGFAALREVVLKFLTVAIASTVIPVIPGLLDYLWPLWDDENRALHDMAIDTRVVVD
jgi:uncharacterized RDD family membrane protein YckC